MTVLEPTDAEQARISQVRANIAAAVRSGAVIPFETCPEDKALYIGHVGDYRYQFEGEEDLLHLIVDRPDKGAITPQEGQAVASRVLAGLKPGLVRLTPGLVSQHFYFGHEDFMRAIDEN